MSSWMLEVEEAVVEEGFSETSKALQSSDKSSCKSSIKFVNKVLIETYTFSNLLLNFLHTFPFKTSTRHETIQTKRENQAQTLPTSPRLRLALSLFEFCKFIHPNHPRCPLKRQNLYHLVA